MYLGKELLLFFIMMMHVCFMASRPTERPNKVAELQTKMKHLTGLPFANLLMVEKDYVKHVLQDDPPEEKTLEPLEGITLPVGNGTEEIEDSVCAIIDYLSEHLPVIIRSETEPPQQEQLLNNTTAFCQQFRRAAETTVTKQCHRNPESSDSYIMKENGFRVIYFTKTWVREFTNT